MARPSLPDPAPALPAPDLPLPDAALLRRAAGRLVRRPGEHGDLFLESALGIDLRRDADGGASVVAGADCGAAARVLMADGGVRHVTCGGLDPEAILALPERLSGAGRSIAPGHGDRAGAPPRSAGGLRRYLDEVERALGAAASGTVWGRAWLATPGALALRERAGSRAQRVLVATSEGEVIEDRRDWTWFTLRVEAQGVAGRPPLTAAFGGGARDLARLIAVHPPASVAAHLAAALEESGAMAPAPAGDLPVVLGPGLGGILFHEACGHALEGDRALSGLSALAHLLGEQVGPACLTLVDDPTLDGLAGSRRYDDEGWSAAATVLVDRGRVTGLLLDRATARRAAAAPTGSARRESWRELPLPRMTNTFVREGTATPEEIVGSVARGLYVAELGAGRVDTASGDFEFQVRRGSILAGGRIVAPVGPCVVSGNGVRALAGVRAVGTDLRFDAGAGECGKDGQRARAAVGQPTLLVEGLSVRPAGGAR